MLYKICYIQTGEVIVLLKGGNGQIFNGTFEGSLCGSMDDHSEDTILSSAEIGDDSRGPM